MRKVIEERRNMYAFLSRIFRVEVDADFMKTLTVMDWASMSDDSVLGNAFARMGKYIKKQYSGTEIALARDFMRCFFGAGLPRGTGAYPYESVYTSPDHLKEQEAMDQVIEIYNEEGLSKSDNFTEPADQLGVELEFMSFLCGQTIEAMDANNEELVRSYIQKQRLFLATHLLNWVPQLCRDLESIAEEDFYRATAVMTKTFLEEDAQNLDVLEKALQPV